jgi:hypothetical protein
MESTLAARRAGRQHAITAVSETRITEIAAGSQFCESSLSTTQFRVPGLQQILADVHRANSRVGYARKEASVLETAALTEPTLDHKEVLYFWWSRWSI